jgi:hypothetical protein
MEFLRQIFAEVANMKFHGKPSSRGAELIHDRQLDRHDETNRRLSRVLRTRLNLSKKKKMNRSC